MRLYLIRHAQSLNNAKPDRRRVADPKLTSVGWEQASRLGEAGRYRDFDRVLVSPFRRTLETATCFSPEVNPEVCVELHEFGGCVSGHAEIGYRGEAGMTGQEIKRQFPSFCVPQEIDGTGWWQKKPKERLVAAFERAQGVASKTQEWFEKLENAAFVSHADFIKLLILAFLEMSLDDLVSYRDPLNASISILRIGQGGNELIEFNDVSHLPATLVTV